MTKRKRVSIELTPDWTKIMDRLRADTKATSNNEVARKAINLYRVLNEHSANGWEVVIKKNGTEKPLLVP